MTSGAALLVEARERAGLSRRALAARAGVPTSTVSRIEAGQIDPTVTMLDRLVTAAGSSLSIDLQARPHAPTLAELSTAVDTNAGRLRIDWTRLRGFTGWVTQHPRRLAAAIAEPPARTGTALDQILAALAEQLAAEHDIDRPRWTRAVGALDEPWSAPSTPRMHEAAAAATPEPFERRNLVLARSALFHEAA